MKAMVFEKYGSANQLKLKEVPRPKPLKHEVIIKVMAASINSWDWDLMRGKPWVNRMSFGIVKPKITALGCDIAGRVEAIGDNVSKWQPGDEVFGDISGGSWGGFAEYACANAQMLASKPSGMTFEEAAAIPQAGVLALQGLRQGKIKFAPQVLINGAGGGTGTFAIQLAKLNGAEVTCVDKQEKFQMMQMLGADHVINYEMADFTKNGLKYHLILDVMGYHSLFDYKKSLADSGIYVMLGGSASLIIQAFTLGPLISKLGSKNLSVLIHRPNADDLNKMITLYEQNHVTPVIDRTYSLEQVPEAMEYFGSGRVKGKVVIKINNPF